MKIFPYELTTIIFSISNFSHANLPLNHPSSSLSISHLPSTLAAFTILQSLKDLNSNMEYPTPFIHDLKNRHHVRTLFVESNHLPIIDIQLAFNAGSARDEEIALGLFGLSNMVAQLMPEETTQYSAEEIASIFENVGAQFNIQTYKDMFIVRLRLLSVP